MFFFFLQGQKGNQGPKGNTGEMGVGYYGLKGDKGARGEPGLPGPASGPPEGAGGGNDVITVKGDKGEAVSKN